MRMSIRRGASRWRSCSPAHRSSSSARWPRAASGSVRPLARPPHRTRGAFHDAMRKLWEDHITWTRLYIVSAATGTADLPGHRTHDRPAARQPGRHRGRHQALLRCRRWRPAHRAPADPHPDRSGDHRRRPGRQDAGAGATPLAAGTPTATTIATFLSSANPDNWPLADMQAMMKSHLDLTLAEAVARLQGRYPDDVAAYDAVHAEYPPDGGHAQRRDHRPVPRAVRGLTSQPAGSRRPRRPPCVTSPDPRSIDLMSATATDPPARHGAPPRRWRLGDSAIGSTSQARRRAIAESIAQRYERNLGEILTALGLDLDTPGTRDTPRRLLAAPGRCHRGLRGRPQAHHLVPDRVPRRHATASWPRSSRAPSRSTPCASTTPCRSSVAPGWATSPTRRSWASASSPGSSTSSPDGSASRSA